MTDRVAHRLWIGVAALLIVACGGSPPTPSSPSPATSFLVGTWRGTVTIQQNPGDPGAPPASSGATTWTFELVPQTNQQSFRATVQSEHPWLAMTTTAITALSPATTPPTQISTQGDYSSPRGCRGTFGSVGTAEASRIDADFTGVDCNLTTFRGRVLLTKVGGGS